MFIELEGQLVNITHIIKAHLDINNDTFVSLSGGHYLALDGDQRTAIKRKITEVLRSSQVIINSITD